MFRWPYERQEDVFQHLSERRAARALEAVEVEDHDLAPRELDDLLVGEGPERALHLLAHGAEPARHGLDGQRARDRERPIPARALAARVGEEERGEPLGHAAERDPLDELDEGADALGDEDEERAREARAVGEEAIELAAREAPRDRVVERARGHEVAAGRRVERAS